MQLELDLNDWRLITSAIKWSMEHRWVEVWNGFSIYVAHFAQDLSGEEQPPFSGWFYRPSEHAAFFFPVSPEPYWWRHLTPTE